MNTGLAARIGHGRGRSTTRTTARDAVSVSKKRTLLSSGEDDDDDDFFARAGRENPSPVINRVVVSD